MDSAAQSPRTESRISRIAGRPLFWIAAIAILFSWPIFRSIQAHSKLPGPRPVLGSAAGFELVDHHGEPFGTEQLRGKVWIVQFYRSDSPPSITEPLEDVQHRTRGLGQSIYLLSLTVAPEIDTVEVLAESAKRHRASYRVWRFLTGSRADIEAAIRGFDTEEARDPTYRPGRLLLVDRQMKIRGTYDLGEGGAIDRLLRDTGLLVNRGE